jgi:hypothetical protein
MSVELAVMDRSTRKVLSWRVWRRDDNQNRAYPSRRTVQQDEATCPWPGAQCRTVRRDRRERDCAGWIESRSVISFFHVFFTCL